MDIFAKTVPAHETIEQALQSLRSADKHALHFGDPLFCLALVRGNVRIQRALGHIAQNAGLRQLAQELGAAVSQGQWASLDTLLGPGLRRANVAIESDAPTDLDLLIHAHWSGGLSLAEFQTAVSLRNLGKQFAEPPASYAMSKAGKRRNLALPGGQGGVVSIHHLFDELGSMTPQGRAYLESIQAIRNDRTFAALASGLDNLERDLKTLPANLQVFFTVQVPKKVAAAFGKYLSGQEWWFDQFKKSAQHPLFNFRYEGQNASFSQPSYGFLQRFLTCMTPLKSAREVSQPAMLLGSGDATRLRKMHAAYEHPVTTYHEHVLSNLLTPHDQIAGHAFAEMHDAIFHAMSCSSVPGYARDILYTILPQMMDALATAPEQKAFAQEIKDMLADTDQLSRGRPFEIEALFTGAVRMALNGNAYRQAPPTGKALMLSFCTALIEQIKQQALTWQQQSGTFDGQLVAGTPYAKAFSPGLNNPLTHFDIHRVVRLAVESMLRERAAGQALDPEQRAFWQTYLDEAGR
ncbi:MAG: hypothetical protein ACRYGK_07395 [Janthinobacterium lividum]